jgi:hypothetical protein
MNESEPAQHFTSQLSRNAVAIISLALAIASLSYNTWRNERNEVNNNMRMAAFELLSTLSELKALVYLGHYDHDTERGNPRIGWTYVVILSDLGELLPEPMPENTRHLKQVWGDSWEGIGSLQSDVDRIDAAIDELRGSTLQLIRTID